MPEHYVALCTDGCLILNYNFWGRADEHLMTVETFHPPGVRVTNATAHS